METDSQTEEFPEEDKKERLYSKLSILIAILLSSGLTFWYYTSNPPDPPDVRKMRLFFKNNATEVMEFIKLPPQELLSAARTKDHPFYETFAKASEVEKEKIRALVHVSLDYSPNQYWFNLAFLWLIFFAALWFIGVMTEGAIQLLNKKRHSRQTP